MSDLQTIPLRTIDGGSASLGDFAGNVLLVVNVASKCGLTPQYEGLEKLYQTYRDQGFEVLGFPANDFAGQEPGSDAEIASFCSTTFDVDFPMFSKIAVTGADKHPLYAALTEARPEASGDGSALRNRLSELGLGPTQPPEVLWNFEKFLIARDGSVAGRFVPPTTAEDPALVAAIEAELAK